MLFVIKKQHESIGLGGRDGLTTWFAQKGSPRLGIHILVVAYRNTANIKVSKLSP